MHIRLGLTEEEIAEIESLREGRNIFKNEFYLILIRMGLEEIKREKLRGLKNEINPRGTSRAALIKRYVNK